MLRGVFFPGFPPAQGHRVHRVAVLTLVAGQQIGDLLPLTNRRRDQHERVQKVVDIQISLCPLPKGKEVNSCGQLLSILVTTSHDLEVMFYPHFIRLFTRSLAELSEAHY